MSDSQWFLEGIQDDKKKWKVKIDEFPFTLGRDAKCNLTLQSAIVSRVHSKIVLHKDEIFISDCKSTNGTILNGLKISRETRLRAGDVIDICDFQYTLLEESDDNNECGTIYRSHDAPVEDFGKQFDITPRELEVISYLVKGLSTKKIAENMFISSGTTKNHILNILKKTNTHSRGELVAKYNNSLK